MKVAVTFDRGAIFQYFARSDKFKIYEIANGKIVSSSVFSTYGRNQSELATLLHTHGVTVLLCGHVDHNARLALSECGIEVHEGVSGNAREALIAWMNGTLDADSMACPAPC